MAEKNEQDILNERLDTIENDLKLQIEEQAKTIEELKNRPQTATEEIDEAIILDRQSAHTMRLPVVEGVPVVEGKLERVVGVEGLEYLMNVKTADDKEYSFPFGCDISKLNFKDKELKNVQTISFEQIQTKDFKLQDIDNNDLTGASKLEKGKIVGEGGVIPEVDRSSGQPIMTGRKIRTVVRRDVRHYTIEHDGKKVVLSSEDLGNIRI